MKKSLILSIVMTLVLVISMSTATFAWYTSQSTVNVTTTELTAAAAVGGSLAIDTVKNTTGTNTSLDVDMTNEASANKPMVPVFAEAPVAGTATDATFASFYTATVDAANKVVSSSAATADKNTTDIYVTNTNKDAESSENINVTVTIAGDRAAELKVAVFAKDEAAAGFIYLGTWGTDVAKYATAASDLAINQSGDLANEYACIASGSASATQINLNGYEAAQIKVIAWFDGVGLVNSEASTTANFTINFEIAE